MKQAITIMCVVVTAHALMVSFRIGAGVLEIIAILVVMNCIAAVVGAVIAGAISLIKRAI